MIWSTVSLVFGSAIITLVIVCWSWLSSWTEHRRAGFYVEEVFDDPKVIDLCLAIEHGDLKKIELLIADGADVNAHGKDNLTPLFWAFFGGHAERMEVLLKHGADPNVSLTKELVAVSIPNGTSVTELAARAHFPHCFELVMQYGGDPNFVNPVSKRPVLFAVISGHGDVLQRTKLLVKKGADVTKTDGQGCTAPYLAAIGTNRCDVALHLLKAGADPSARQYGPEIRLIDKLIIDEGQYTEQSSQKRRDYHALLDWLMEHGESLEVK